MPTKTRIRWAIIPLILAGGIATWYINTFSQEEAPTEVVRTVRVVRPERVDMEDRFSVRGFLETNETVTVLPLVSGGIQAIDVEIGDTVTKDDRIALIDPAPYQLTLSQAEASFAAAESTFQRTQQLFEANATPIQNLDQARAQYEAARAQRDLARLRLGYTQLRSPIDGVVLIRHLAVGDIASTERPVVTIGDVTDLVIRAGVPEERYRVFAQSSATIDVRLTVAGRNYPGSIRTVGPYVAAETRTFEVICTVDDDDTVLRPGMSVTVTFILATRQDVLSLPIEALGYGNTLWYVEDNRAWSMDAPDIFSTGDRLEIPPTERDRVFIVAGHHFLENGRAVEIVGDSE